MGESSTMADFSTIEESGPQSDTLPDLSTVNLTCNQDFFEQNFTCLPRCDMWDERPQAFATIDSVVRIGLVVS